MKLLNVEVKTIQKKLWDFCNNIVNINKRNKLKNKDFTIISSNCIGGIICHQLKVRCNSPTRNLWINNKEFIEFAQNFEEYMNSELYFLETDEGYPVAKVYDASRLHSVVLHFNHAHSEEEAKYDWERRKKRINYNNMYFIMADVQNVTLEDIRKFKNIKCKGRAVLTDKRYPDIPYVYTCTKGTYPWFKRNIVGNFEFEKYFDYVSWLNSTN